MKKTGVVCMALLVMGVAGGAELITNGLVVHLADDVTLDQDGRVTRWTDLTGNGHHAEPMAGQGSPLYVTDATPAGTGAIRFDSFAGNEALQIAGNSVFDGVPLTVFMVYNRTGDGDVTHARILNFAYGDIGDGSLCNIALLLVNRRNGDVRAHGRSVTNENVETSYVGHGFGQGSYNIGGVIWDGTDEVTAFIADSEDTSQTQSLSVTGANMAPSDHLYIRIGAGSWGVDDFGVRFPHEGEIAEVLIYTRVLSGEEIGEVQAYLYDTHLASDPEPEPFAISIADAVYDGEQVVLAIDIDSQQPLEFALQMRPTLTDGQWQTVLPVFTNEHGHLVHTNTSGAGFYRAVVQ